ncbi:hypothetical protein [Streptomyces violens]|uniref:hypothetical protein n=1 Tax=Streptomyces violens TaxID=66377 RepID=UPI00068CF093|nr:hypothetical protein [Streptomyces violens]
MAYVIAGFQDVQDVDDDPMDLVIGTPTALWLGVPGESDEERLARLDAARDILADEPELMDLVTRITVEAIEAETPDLLAAHQSCVAFAGHYDHTPTEGLG